MTVKEKKFLFNFTGPLGTFAYKIDIAKAIGLLDDNLFSDLHKVRSVRNLAAHTGQEFSLANPNVKAIVSSMEFDGFKTGQLRRYKVTPEGNGDPHAEGDVNESIMKGYGFVSAYRSNFIITTRRLQLELVAVQAGARVAGASVRKIVEGVHSHLFDEKKDQTD